MEVEAGPVPVENEVKPEQGDEDARPKPEGEATEGNEGGDEEGKEGDDETLAPPTTRSKTAPFRRPSTPEPTPPPTIKRGVFTLSDVHAARAVLAEKANQHWMKGLGGGQNREGETIVNFLYKNKVGHGECLLVYACGYVVWTRTDHACRTPHEPTGGWIVERKWRQGAGSKVVCTRRHGVIAIIALLS